MKKNQIAAQGYTIRELCKTPESTDIAFGRVKAAGYDAIQLSGQWHIGVDTLAELTKKHGLEVCATHIGFQEMVDDLPGAREPRSLPCVRQEVQRDRPAPARRGTGCDLPQPQLRIRFLRRRIPDGHPL